MNSKDYLYRLYGKRRVLLYVGRSYRWDERLIVDHAKKPWYGEVMHFTIETFKGSALEPEQDAIVFENPRYNKKLPVGPVVERCLMAGVSFEEARAAHVSRPRPTEARWPFAWLREVTRAPRRSARTT